MRTKVREWMKQIARGDKDALRELFACLGGTLRGAAKRAGADDSLADETVNAILYLVWNDCERLSKLDNPVGYLSVSAYHYAIDKRRGIRDTAPLEDADRKALPQDPDERLHIRDTLAALDKRERKILLLHADAGYSLAECAAALNLSYFAARRLLLRAKAHFIRLYKDS